MHFVIFGLTVSSSWGNGHATLWRGLIKALARRGHTITFYEKDVPWYAMARDAWPHPAGFHLRLYSDLNEARSEAERELLNADVAMITSYCPDAGLASKLVLDSSARVRSFYDLDTPVTLAALSSGECVPYIPSQGLSDFDLVLSYTGGKALDELQSRLGARTVAPLYGSVDPEAHAPAAPRDEFRADLSYLGTYAADRQPALEELFVRPAGKMPDRRFVLAGAQYPRDFPWTPNIFFVQHLEPSLHPAFFCSSRITLNITRRAMAEYGYCPSGRLFEAAACGAAIVSDWWEGLDSFFAPGTEILRVDSAADVIAAINQPDKQLRAIGQAARHRALAEHTAAHRAITLENCCNQVAGGYQRTTCTAA
jgi:spore maturation protein CgeB